MRKLGSAPHKGQAIEKAAAALWSPLYDGLDGQCLPIGRAVGGAPHHLLVVREMADNIKTCEQCRKDWKVEDGEEGSL